jgi:hypothetical protein
VRKLFIGTTFAAMENHRTDSIPNDSYPVKSDRLLGGYVTLIDPGWSTSAVKLAVDTGVLAISLASLLIRRPFTLQYAREMVDAQTVALPGFLRVNYILSGAWTLAFLLMVMANVLLIYLPGLPLWSGIVIAFAARNTALYFTKWYPQYRRGKYPAPAASAGTL